VAGTPSIQDLPKEREYDLIFKKYTGQTVPAGAPGSPVHPDWQQEN